MKKMNHIEYPKTLRDKSIDSLRFIALDAKEAIRVQPNSENASYYADEICYVSDEIRSRNTNKG